MVAFRQGQAPLKCWWLYHPVETLPVVTPSQGSLSCHVGCTLPGPPWTDANPVQVPPPGVAQAHPGDFGVFPQTALLPLGPLGGVRVLPGVNVGTSKPVEDFFIEII